MDEPIEDCVGDGAITEIRMPLIERELTRDEGRFAVVAVIEDFQKVSHGLIAERREPEVIEHDQIDFGELAEERRTFLQSRVAGELIDQAREPKATHGVIGAARGMRDGRGEEAFANPGGARDQHDPRHARQ